MRGIEKDLSNYLKQVGRKVNKETVVKLIDEDADELINTVLKTILDEADRSIENIPLDRVKELLSYIQNALEISSDIDRKVLMRKLSKMELKLEYFEVEQKKKTKDKKKVRNKIEKISDEIAKIKNQIEDKETKKYDFMNYLVKDVQNIQYLECVLMKLPNLVNIRDKNNISIFQNTVNYYVTAIRKEDLKEELYYSNLLSLFLSSKNIQLSLQDKKNILMNLSRVVHEISSNRENNAKEKIKKINSFITNLKGDNNKRCEIEKIASKYDIPVFFEKGIIEQVNLIHTSYHEEEDRPIVNHYVITIDGEGTVEIDDGLSCEKLPNGNYLLGVHIASVLSYFPYQSKIVNDAINRNQSIYLPSKYQEKCDDFQKVIPIFPYKFSTECASLLEGEKRLTRSYFFELNKDGEIIDEKFMKSIIVNQNKTSFDEIDTILKDGCDNKPLLDTVINLQKVSEILDKRYKVNSTYEIVKEDSCDYSDLRVKRIGAEKIVYQIMLLTGNRVADYFADKGYPCLYRVHEVNSYQKNKINLILDDLKKTYGGDQYQQISQLLKGIYPMGWYDIKGHHLGLGVEHYCHCTSSIRRAADIIIEHALEECYDKVPSDRELVLLEEDILNKKELINAKEEPISWFVKEYKKTFARRR